MKRNKLTLLLASVAQFMIVVDLTIVNVALPSIQRDLHISSSTLQWIVIAYGLLFGGFLLLGGRLGDLFGRRRVLLTGLLLFTAASLFAGLADSTPLLIIARALQGFGAALIAPSALAIVAATFTEGKERNAALGIFGAVGGIAASVGVLVSGLLTDGPGWPWIFFINIPIGLALLFGVFKLLAPDHANKGDRTVDMLSATAATTSLLLFVYGLNRAVDSGWVSSSVLGLFAGAIVVFLAYLWIESRSTAPLIPTAALRNKHMVASDITALFAFGSFYSFIFLGTLLMQDQLGYSPTKTGVTWLITSLTAFVAAGLTGAKLAAKFGTKRLLVIALILVTIGAAWMTRLPVTPTFAIDLLPAFLLVGIGIGLIGPSIQISALAGVKERDHGLASGLVETARELGGVIVIAVVSTVLSTYLKGNLPTEGFRHTFWVIVIAAAIGVIVAALTLKKHSRTQV